MLPLVLGGVALATVGYGVKKYIADEDFRLDVNDKIQDGLIKGYEGIEWVEEKMGLNEVIITKEEQENQKIVDILTQRQIDDSKKLFEYKHKIRKKLKNKYNIKVCSSKEIKQCKLKIQTFLLTSIPSTDMRTIDNIKKYQELIGKIYQKIISIKKEKSKEELSPYLDVLRKLFITNTTTKKGEFNEKSNAVINEAIQILNKE